MISLSFPPFLPPFPSPILLAKILLVPNHLHKDGFTISGIASKCSFSYFSLAYFVIVKGNCLLFGISQNIWSKT